MSDSIIVTTANLVSVIVSETQGPPGLGVPAGGTTGQVLAKVNATDFNTQWVAAAAGIGSGDVVGPASAVADNFASFNATTGKLIKDSGSKASDFAAAAHNHSGVYAPVLGVDDNYVTAAEKVKLTALSGTNSGDNAVNSTYADDYRAANFSAGTHYLAPNGSAAALTAFPTLNQNTTGNAATATNLTGLTTPVATLNNQSGTNTGDNAVNSLYAGLVTNATHTGDVTGATALTIAAGAVTLAKQANMATASLVYRKTAGAGAPEVQTLATLKTDLGLTGANSGDQDLSGLAVKANNLSDLANAVTARTNLGLGTLATQNGTFSGTSSGTNTGDQTLSDATISLTDITTNNFSITKHGFVPKGTNTGAFLKDDGTWGTPAGGTLNEVSTQLQFTPTAIPNCALWLGPDGFLKSDNTLCTDGTAVSKWLDMSGNGRDCTVQGGSSPTYSSTGKNNKGSFTGGKLATQAFMTSGYTNNYTIFFVSSEPATYTGWKNKFSVSDATGTLYYSSNASTRDLTANGITGIGPALAPMNTIGGIDAISISSTSAYVLTNFTGINNNTSNSLSRTAITASGTTFTNGSLCIGGYKDNNTDNWVGKISEVIFYNRPLIDSEISEVLRYLRKKYETKTLISCLGDSITSGDGQTLAPYGTGSGASWPGLLWGELTSSAFVRTDSYPGRSAVQIYTETPYHSQIYARSSNTISIIFVGSNDLQNTGSPAAVYEYIKKCCLQRLNTGGRVIVSTLLYRADVNLAISTVNTDIVNNLIRANWSTFAHALVDPILDSRLQNPNDTTYFKADKIHPNAANGHPIVKDIMSAAVSAVLGSDSFIRTNEQTYDTKDNLDMFGGITTKQFNDVYTPVANGTNAQTTGKLSQFAATTSLELKDTISDETGSGALVFATSPALVTPVLGTPASGNLANCTFPTLNQNTTGNAATATNLTGLTTTVATLNNQSGTNTGDQTLSDATISLTDITTNNFSITKHGFVPKGTNTGAFLKDDGTWGTPAGGSALAILDEGVSKTAACTSIDFTGAGITATNTGGAVTVNVAGGGGSGDALVANPLSQFAATTSAQLAGVLSDETGFSTGAKAVFSINPAFSTSITVDGYINITGTNFGLYTTPVGSSVPSKIGIPSLAIAAFGQVVAFGLNSGSAASSRALSLFDQRAGAHQPTLGVFGVDEMDLCGFSWEGTSNFCSIKSYGAAMGFNIAGTNLSSFSTTEAIINTKLSVATSASPTARLHIAAGSASANTAPLKLTSGPLLTTAEAGAIEFLTDAFYATITTGAARRKMITAPTTPTAVTGSRGGNAALASLLTALAGLGIITDSSTA